MNILKRIMTESICVVVTGRHPDKVKEFVNKLVNYVDPVITIKVFEDSGEKELRDLYPCRNVIYSNSIETIDLKDAFVRHDAYCTVCQCMDKDDKVIRVLQDAALCSNKTICGNHSIDTESLILSLRNSMCNKHGLPVEVAINMVTDVVTHNIHLDENGEIEFIDKINKTGDEHTIESVFRI